MSNTEEGIMMWYGLSSNELLGPYFFDETVTGSTYRQMLPRQTRAHFNSFLRVKMCAFYAEKTLKSRFLLLKKSTLRASLSSNLLFFSKKIFFLESVKSAHFNA